MFLRKNQHNKLEFNVYLQLATLCLCSQMTVSKSMQEANCTIGHLDNKSYEECGNRGYAMRCNNTNLNQIPNHYPKPDNMTKFPPPLCLLDLGFNIFTKIENNSFVNVKNLNTTDVLWLYLEYSNVSFIASQAFTNLTNLLYLNLTGNKLYQPESFGVGVFKPLKNLKNINLKENNFYSFDCVGNELQHVTTLEGLYIDLCSTCEFGYNFSTLTSLKTLSLIGRSKHACNAPHIGNETFRYVPFVEKLFMSSCYIETIDKAAFSFFGNLSLLDISYNEKLTFSGMNNALYGLQNSTTLKELNVNRIHKLFEIGIKLKLSDIQYLKTLRALEKLHMDLNKIEVFDEKIFNPSYQLPATLRHLTLSGNRLTHGKFQKYIHRAEGIKYLDLSRQHLNYDPFFNKHYEGPRYFNSMNISQLMNTDFTNLQINADCPGICVVCLPKSISSIKWRKSMIYLHIDTPFAICGAAGLKRLDLSFNLISRWTAVIFGVENIKHLDLSDNICDAVTPEFFLNFKSLKHLNISTNNLGPVFDLQLNENASKIFQNLKNLTHLDMSYNKIYNLPQDLFSNLSNLMYLNLSDNNICGCNISLDNIRCLRSLDLSSNKIYSLPERLRLQLDAIADEDCNKNVTVKIMLYSNPIECDCKHLPFLKWMLKTKVAILFKEKDVCRLDGESYPYPSYIYERLDELVHKLENDICRDKSWITWTISASCSVFVGILTLIAGCLMYRNRWKLRYIYYSRNRRHVHDGFEHLFENDAFVSYAKNNASFIKNEMVPKLETEHNLHLWVADRNALAGASVAENISHAIYNSRKSVLLINREYLLDSWCDYEMNMARQESIETNRQLIVIVLMEQIPMNSVPIGLMKFLHNERSLEYPVDQQDRTMFWANLATEINAY
nr:Toll-like receptor [Ruditapes philippinarum]